MCASDTMCLVLLHHIKRHRVLQRDNAVTEASGLGEVENTKPRLRLFAAEKDEARRSHGFSNPTITCAGTSSEKGMFLQHPRSHFITRTLSTCDRR